MLQLTLQLLVNGRKVEDETENKENNCCEPIWKKPKRLLTSTTLENMVKSDIDTDTNSENCNGWN